MQKEHQPYNIQPADRLANVSEYYFSRKLKEVAQMNAEGKNVISLGIGSPDRFRTGTGRRFRGGGKCGGAKRNAGRRRVRGGGKMSLRLRFFSNERLKK